MRILTRTQYEAICDIVTDLQKENEELKAKIAKKDKTIDYLNSKLSKRNREIIMARFEKTPMVHIASVDDLNLDFPATQKPENILF